MGTALDMTAIGPRPMGLTLPGADFNPRRRTLGPQTDEASCGRGSVDMCFGED